MRAHAQLLAHLFAPAADRREALVVIRQLEEDALDLLVDRGREQAERLDARGLRGERGVGRVRAEDAVHLARHLTEPAHALEEGVRRSRDLVESELPAVLSVADELLEDPERRAQRSPRVRVPAAERGDVRETVLGQETEHLELRVDPRLEPPEDLEDRLVVEDDRRVRLLRTDGTRVEQLAAEAREPLDRPELDRPFLALQRQARAHCVHELACRCGVLERVDVVLAVHQLVDVVRAGVVAHLDEREHELRVHRAQYDGVELLRVGHRPRLRAVPPALRDVLDHRTLVGSHAPAFSWNQKKPRGASVNK